MAIFRVKAGFRFGAENQYGPGDNIELSVEEAEGFLDKLELRQAQLPVTELAEVTGDSLSTIEPWNGLEAKIVITLEAAQITPAMIATLRDEELLMVQGVGPASLVKIRSAFRGDAE
jgi:hypothetical protein